MVRGDGPRTESSFCPRGVCVLEGVLGADPEDGVGGCKWGRVILTQFPTTGTSLSQLSGSLPVLDPRRPFSPGQTRTTSPPPVRKPGGTRLRPEQQGQRPWRGSRAEAGALRGRPPGRREEQGCHFQAEAREFPMEALPAKVVFLKPGF